MSQKKFIQPPGSTMPGAQPAQFVDPSAQAPTAQVNLNPNDLDDIICECGSYTFTQVMILKRVPALLAPNGQEGITGNQVLACYSCGKVPEMIVKTLSGWFKAEADNPGENDSDIITTDLPDLQKVEIPDESAD